VRSTVQTLSNSTIVPDSTDPGAGPYWYIATIICTRDRRSPPTAPPGRRGHSGTESIPARVRASEDLLDEISDDETLRQLKNATHLPGVRKYAVCMPDGHKGYGFSVGGERSLSERSGPRTTVRGD